MPRDEEAETVPAPLAAASRPPETEGAPVVAGRYELLGMLGAGAMGTVYRARDRELDETVALKMLRRELANAPDMIERFRREVKLARRVTHRNVARMFDIGDADGERFLTMELVDGEMLGAMVARRGALTIDEALRMAAEIASGLAVAHAAGVLHRDLKPENVIVAGDGRAVITDFGIARALAGAELARSMPGAIAGTPAYMAPEQVEGVADLDARADLYALGVMLFELLTGAVPWQGDSVVAIAAARLLRPPPDPRTKRPDLPAPVAELVRKLMARRREDRFATADEARAALLALIGTLSTTTLLRASDPQGPTSMRASASRAVAVLPILVLGSSDDAYLAQALTEDLVDLLTAVPGLRVRPRGEAARWSSASRDVREAGRELGVDVVVDGSVRRIGDTVRIAVRLMTVADGFQLWARRFDRKSGELLGVGDEAAAAIAHALAAEHAPTARRAMSPEAEDLYLRGRFLARRAWIEVAQQGVDLLARAHALEPDDPRITGAYALGLARGRLAYRDEATEVIAAVRALVDDALARDATQPEARMALAHAHLRANECVAAAVEIDRVLAAAPSSVDALDFAGRLLCEAGDVERGLTLLRRALAIEPNMLPARYTIARVYALLGDHEAFDRWAGERPEHVGDAIMWGILRGHAALWRADRDAATTLRERIAGIALPPFAESSVYGLLGVLSSRAMDDALAARLERDLPAAGPRRRTAIFAAIRTDVYAWVGRWEDALRSLRTADENGAHDLFWMDRSPFVAELAARADIEPIRARAADRARRVVETLRVTVR